LACIWAPAAGGEVVTKPLTFAGDHLEINFSTSAAGFVRVEIQDAGGSPIPGYTLDDAQEMIGNDIGRVVRWKRGSNVAELAGRSVRLRLAIRDAELYSLRFQ
jgi:hypothetical protein